MTTDYCEDVIGITIERLLLFWAFVKVMKDIVWFEEPCPYRCECLRR
jgi:hypothetical protein